MKYQKLIKNSSLYSISAVVQAVTGVAQNIIVAIILGPALFGLLQIYRIILSYAAHTNLGMVWAMLRLLPFYRGRNEYGEVENVKNVTFTLTIISGIVPALLLFIVCIFISRYWTISLFDIFLIALVIIAQKCYSFFTYYLLADNKFTLRSKGVVFFSLLNFICMIVFVVFFKIQGVLLSLLLTNIVLTFYFSIKIRFKAKMIIMKEHALNLIKTGLSVVGNGFSNNILLSVDKIMIARFIGTVQLGFYGMAAMIKQTMELFYMSVFMTIFPGLTEKYAKAKDITGVKNYVLKPLLVFSHIFPLVVGSLFMIVPLAIKIILPKYIEGTVAAQMVILSCFFACLQSGIPNFFIAINKIHKIYKLRIATIIFAVVLIYFAIINNYGIVGVSLSVIFYYAFSSTILIYYFLDQYSIRLSERLKFFFQIYYPFIYMIFSLWLVYVFGRKLLFVENEFLILLIKLIIFFCFNIPLFIYIDKKTSIIKELRKFAIGFFNRIIKKPSLKAVDKNA